VPRDPDADRRLLAHARLMLLFTPELCAGREPESVLAAALPSIDVVQVRPKPLASAAPGTAAETLAWTRRVLALRDRLRPDVLVLVNDRVDVARLLASEGCSGVHLGQDDCPLDVARGFLGADALIGWSTHTLEQVLEGETLGADYLGFGPFAATATKGYARGLGPEQAWIASGATALPLFPIGGIGRENAQELVRVGRACVGSAILGADDPGRAARELAEMLAGAASDD
jgi:thiamine-phosphate pyrophosphorylase